MQTLNLRRRVRFAVPAGTRVQRHTCAWCATDFDCSPGAWPPARVTAVSAHDPPLDTMLDTQLCDTVRRYNVEVGRHDVMSRTCELQHNIGPLYICRGRGTLRSFPLFFLNVVNLLQDLLS
jgi:hypothetical protein